MVTVGTNAKGRGCRENRLRVLVLLGALKSGASPAKVSSALPAPRLRPVVYSRLSFAGVCPSGAPRTGSKGLGGAASWPLVQLTVPSVFCRASEAAGQAAQQLPAELHHAGAHRLLHHHGAVLHEGDRQQGEAQRAFAGGCAPCPQPTPPGVPREGDGYAAELRWLLGRSARAPGLGKQVVFPERSHSGDQICQAWGC